MFSLATKNLQLKTRQGQGLIETIIGMSVLVTGIVSLMSIVVAASTARTANEYITVASNLAREGIEVVVTKRNDNWIVIPPVSFDNGMYTGTNYTFGLAFNPAVGSWSLVNNPVSPYLPNTVDDTLAKIYQFPSGTHAGLMVQGTVATPTPVVGGVTAVATIYSRLVALDPICYDGSTETVITSGTCSGSPGKIGVRITSTVQWTDRGVKHNISAVETIYDWK